MLKKIKQYFKSKTIWAATIISVLGVIESNFHFLQDYLKEYYGVSWVIFSVIMVVLRAVTTQSLDDK